MHRHVTLRIRSVGDKIRTGSLKLAHIRLSWLLDRRLCLRGVTKRDKGTEKERKHLLVQFLEHLAKEVEALELVDEERVLLLVCSVLDRLREVVHIAQVLLPVLINLVKGDGLAESTRNLLTLRLIGLLKVD